MNDFVIATYISGAILFVGMGWFDARTFPRSGLRPWAYLAIAALWPLAIMCAVVAVMLFDEDVHEDGGDE